MDGIEIKSAYLKSIRVGKIQAKFSADGTRVLRYYLDFWNEELSLHKELAATDLHLLQSKANELMAAWDRKVSEHRKKSKVVAGKDAADQMTVDALGRLERLNKISTALRLSCVRRDFQISALPSEGRRSAGTGARR